MFPGCRNTVLYGRLNHMMQPIVQYGAFIELELRPSGKWASDITFQRG